MCEVRYLIPTSCLVRKRMKRAFETRPRRVFSRATALGRFSYRHDDASSITDKKKGTQWFLDHQRSVAPRGWSAIQSFGPGRLPCEFPAEWHRLTHYSSHPGGFWRQPLRAQVVGHLRRCLEENRFAMRKRPATTSRFPFLSLLLTPPLFMSWCPFGVFDFDESLGYAALRLHSLLILFIHLWLD